MNFKSNVLLVAAMTVALLSGCNRCVDMASTPCDELGKTTDPAVQADLEKKCPRGGPTFKSTPPKTY